MYVHRNAGASQRPEEGIGFLGAGVLAGCDLLNTGVGIKLRSSAKSKCS